jgi:hypothetical protein
MHLIILMVTRSKGFILTLNPQKPLFVKNSARQALELSFKDFLVA